jgi:hypothetical protein
MADHLGLLIIDQDLTGYPAEVFKALDQAFVGVFGVLAGHRHEMKAARIAQGVMNVESPLWLGLNWLAEIKYPTLRRIEKSLATVGGSRTGAPSPLPQVSELARARALWRGSHTAIRLPLIKVSQTAVAGLSLP